LLLTPDGHISRYFSRDYPSSNVRWDCGRFGGTGNPVDHILFCYQYDPTKARYSATIFSVIRRRGGSLCMAIADFPPPRSSRGQPRRFQAGLPTQGAL
jgi:hypothetical protein